jgi:hypothetical protein
LTTQYIPTLSWQLEVWTVLTTQYIPTLSWQSEVWTVLTTQYIPTLSLGRTIRSMNSFDYPVYSNSVVRSYWYITRHNVMMQSSHIMLWCNPILPVTIILYQSSNVRPKCWCLVCKRAFVTNYVDWPTSSLNVKWTEHFGFQWITNDTHSKCAGLGAAKYCILRPRNLTFSEHEALVYILS